MAGIHQDATMEEVEAAAKAANASDFIHCLASGSAWADGDHNHVAVEIKHRIRSKNL